MTMIYIIDVSSKFLSNNLKENQHHPRYSILSRIFWYKNVNEEQDAPDHIFLGSQDTSYCILIVLSTCLEFFISKGHMENTDFSFGIHGQNEPILIKDKAAGFMKKTLNYDNFRIIYEGKRGTRSIIKMVTTRCRRCGCSKDEADMRAFWK